MKSDRLEICLGKCAGSGLWSPSAFVRLAAGAIAVLAFSGVSVEAAIPPSGYLVKKLVSKRTGIRALRVRSSVSVLDSGFAGDSADSFRFRAISFVDLDARSVRTRVLDDQGQILLEGERKWGDGAGDPKLPKGFAGNPASPVTLSLLFETSSDLLGKKLQEAGVPILGETELREMESELVRRERERMGFGRLGDAIAWVIGSDRGAALARESRLAAEAAAKAAGSEVEPTYKGDFKPSQSQVWIQRDTLTPLRLLLRNTTGQKQGWDIRMESPKPLRDGHFPRLIAVMDLEKAQEDPFDINPRAVESRRRSDSTSAVNAAKTAGKARVIAEEIIEISVNPDMSTELPLVKSEWSDVGEDLDSKSQRAIELYFRTLR